MTDGAAEAATLSGASDGLSQTQEHDQRPVERYEVLVTEAAETILQADPRDGGHLVDHDPARSVQPVEHGGLDRGPGQWCLHRVGRERADRHRGR